MVSRKFQAYTASALHFVFCFNLSLYLFEKQGDREREDRELPSRGSLPKCSKLVTCPPLFPRRTGGELAWGSVAGGDSPGGLHVPTLTAYAHTGSELCVRVVRLQRHHFCQTWACVPCKQCVRMWQAIHPEAQNQLLSVEGTSVCHGPVTPLHS